LGNAFKLGSSLLLTWGIALGMRLYIPRFLGPEKFGVLSFAQAFTTAAFIVLALGTDNYIRREIAVRPDHASDFMGGVLVLRAFLLVLVFVGMEAVLQLMGRGEEARYLVYWFGIAQFFFVFGNTSAALLHAKGEVNEMSVLSVLTKIVWAGGLLAAIVCKLELWAFAAAFALSEGLKAIGLFWLAKKNLGFSVAIRTRSTAAALLIALPFYVTELSTTIYNHIDKTILIALGTDQEVGWYGAAQGLAGLTLLLTPLIGWVLLPLFSRAIDTSDHEFDFIVRRSMEFIMALAIQASLILVTGAEFWISLIFGEAFAPAVPSMKLFSLACLLMYANIVLGSSLLMLKRTWPMAFVFVGGLIVNPGLNLLLVPYGLATGDGGGASACALVALLTEVYIAAGLLYLLGRRSFDARLGKVVAKSLGSAAVVLAVDTFLLRSLGPVHVVLAALLYVVLVVVLRAHDVREIRGWITAALSRRRGIAG
jgi:O-antigen/teichoic acid export membrane protein